MSGQPPAGGGFIPMQQQGDVPKEGMATAPLLTFGDAPPPQVPQAGPSQPVDEMDEILRLKTRLEFIKRTVPSLWEARGPGAEAVQAEARQLLQAIMEKTAAWAAKQSGGAAPPPAGGGFAPPPGGFPPPATGAGAGPPPAQRGAVIIGPGVFVGGSGSVVIGGGAPLPPGPVPQGVYSGGSFAPTGPPPAAAAGPAFPQPPMPPPSPVAPTISESGAFPCEDQHFRQHGMQVLDVALGKRGDVFVANRNGKIYYLKDYATAQWKEATGLRGQMLIRLQTNKSGNLVGLKQWPPEPDYDLYDDEPIPEPPKIQCFKTWKHRYKKNAEVRSYKRWGDFGYPDAGTYQPHVKEFSCPTTYVPNFPMSTQMWCIDEKDNKIYRLQDSPGCVYVQVPGTAKMISCNKGIVVAVGTNGAVYSWNESMMSWKQMPGNAKTVHVDSNAVVRCVDAQEGKRYIFNPGRQTWVPETAGEPPGMRFVWAKFIRTEFMEAGITVDERLFLRRLATYKKPEERSKKSSISFRRAEVKAEEPKPAVKKTTSTYSRSRTASSARCNKWPAKTPGKLCHSCSFGSKKDRCCVCDGWPAKDTAKLCHNCSFGGKKDKCCKCGGWPARNEAKLCHNCHFGQGKDKCAATAW